MTGNIDEDLKKSPQGAITLRGHHEDIPMSLGPHCFMASCLSGVITLGLTLQLGLLASSFQLQGGLIRRVTCFILLSPLGSHH